MNTLQLPLELLDQIVETIDYWECDHRQSTLQACACVSWPLLLSCRRRLFRVAHFRLGGDRSYEHNLFTDETMPCLYDFLDGDPCLSYRRRARGYPPLSSNIRELHINIGPVFVSECTLSCVSNVLGRLGCVESLYVHGLSVSDTILPGLLNMFKTSPLRLVKFFDSTRIPTHLFLSCPNLQHLTLWNVKYLVQASSVSSPLPELRHLDINSASLDLLFGYIQHPRGAQMFSYLEELTTSNIDVVHSSGSIHQLFTMNQRSLRVLRCSGFSNLPSKPISPTYELDLSALPLLTLVSLDLSQIHPIAAYSFEPLWVFFQHTTHPTSIQKIEFVIQAPVDPYSMTLQEYLDIIIIFNEINWERFDVLLSGPNYPSLESLRIEINLDMTPDSEDELPWEETAVEVEAEIKKYVTQTLPRAARRGVLEVAVFLILEDLDDESIDSSDWYSEHEFEEDLEGVPA